MVTVNDIERAIEQLSPEELRLFRAWFAEHDALEWDRHFEEDAAAGRLDRLAEDALHELREGRCKDL